MSKDGDTFDGEREQLGQWLTEDDHLGEVHGLVRTTAYIHAHSSKTRSDSADRVAMHRQRKREQGLVQVDVPAEMAKRFKAAGSFMKWREQYALVPLDQVPMVRESISIARRVKTLPKWIRFLLKI